MASSAIRPTDAAAPRRTKQRTAVTEILLDQSDFRTAQHIHDDLRAHGHTIGLSTVYRTLQMMVDAGELDMIRVNGGEAAYRRCSTGHHHHLVCRNCGRTVEVLGPTVEKWATTVAAGHGFRDIQHDLEIFGTCGNC